MIPTDHEFALIYIIYGMLLAFLIFRTKISDRKKYYKNHLIFLCLYTVILIYVFSDKTNFEGGVSLGVLVLAAFFVMLHLLILLLFKIYQEIKKVAN